MFENIPEKVYTPKHKRKQASDIQVYVNLLEPRKRHVLYKCRQYSRKMEEKPDISATDFGIISYIGSLEDRFSSLQAKVKELQTELNHYRNKFKSLEKYKRFQRKKNTKGTSSYPSGSGFVSFAIKTANKKSNRNRNLRFSEIENGYVNNMKNRRKHKKQRKKRLKKIRESKATGLLERIKSIGQSSAMKRVLRRTISKIDFLLNDFTLRRNFGHEYVHSYFESLAKQYDVKFLMSFLSRESVPTRYHTVYDSFNKYSEVYVIKKMFNDDSLSLLDLKSKLGDYLDFLVQRSKKQ